MEEQQKSKIEKKIRFYRRASRLSLVPLVVGAVGLAASIFAKSNHVSPPQDFPIQRYGSLVELKEDFRDAGSWEEDVRAYLSNNYRELSVPEGFPTLQAYENEIENSRQSIKDVSARAIAHCDNWINEVRGNEQFRDYFSELDRWKEIESSAPAWFFSCGSGFCLGMISLMKKDELERKLKEEDGK